MFFLRRPFLNNIFELFICRLYDNVRVKGVYDITPDNISRAGAVLATSSVTYVITKLYYLKICAIKTFYLN